MITMGKSFDVEGFWKDRFTTTLTKFKDTGLYLESNSGALTGLMSCHKSDEEFLADDSPVNIPFAAYDQGTRFGSKYGLPYFILVHARDGVFIATVDANFTHKPKMFVKQDNIRAEISKAAFKGIV